MRQKLFRAKTSPQNFIFSKFFFQESMSSGDLHNSFNTERAASIFNGKNLLKLNNNNLHEAEEKRLEELVVDVVRLKNEKGELLRQNVTCRTDIKKLKERFVKFNFYFF
jgi:hypothetical protein